MQPPVAEDVGRARPPRGHELPGEAELLAELNRRRFLHEEGIGPRVDREPVAVFGANQSAEARRGLEKDELDVAARELERGREAGNAAADDDDHGCTSARVRLPPSA